MTSLVIKTALGQIVLSLHRDRAPATVAHVAALAASGAFDSAATIYRSDFVIQCGLHGSGRASPLPPLSKNESPGGLSNTRGAMAVAHWDVPDCGNSEFFISLKANAHLDSVYGGYCVFASVAPGDAASFATVDAIAAAVLRGDKPQITSFAVL
jgi:cyclophilin family peptidyl-prolyl cis-trans isomerase